MLVALTLGVKVFNGGIDLVAHRLPETAHEEAGDCGDNPHWGRNDEDDPQRVCKGLLERRD